MSPHQHRRRILHLRCMGVIYVQQELLDNAGVPSGTHTVFHSKNRDLSLPEAVGALMCVRTPDHFKCPDSN